MTGKWISLFSSHCEHLMFNGGGGGGGGMFQQNRYENLVLIDVSFTTQNNGN